MLKSVQGRSARLWRGNPVRKQTNMMQCSEKNLYKSGTALASVLRLLF